MRVQTQTFTVRKQAHDGEAMLYDRQIQQLRAKAAGLMAQRKSREQLVASYESERVDFEALVRQGYAERQRVREMERNVAQSEGQRASLVSDLAATELQISETQVKILQLARNAARGGQGAGRGQAELSAVREKFRSLQDTVERTVGAGPDAGMVLGLSVHTLGRWCAPANACSTSCAEREAGGRDAAVAAGHRPGARRPDGRGALPGVQEARHAAHRRPADLGVGRPPDGRERRTQGARTTWRVWRSRRGPAGADGRQAGLAPGMPAEVLVTTGNRTMLQYLVAPLSDTVARSFKQH